jgi:hypothetical protein
MHPYLVNDYGEQVHILHNRGVPVDTLYMALSELLTIDLRGVWNSVESALRIDKLKAALLARKADILRMAKELSALTGAVDAIAPVSAEAPVTPSVALAASLGTIADRPLRGKIMWSRHPH